VDDAANQMVLVRPRAGLPTARFVEDATIQTRRSHAVPDHAPYDGDQIAFHLLAGVGVAATGLLGQCRKSVFGLAHDDSLACCIRDGIKSQGDVN
jgi:hypothetical protein